MRGRSRGVSTLFSVAVASENSPGAARGKKSGFGTANGPAVCANTEAEMCKGLSCEAIGTGGQPTGMGEKRRGGSQRVEKEGFLSERKRGRSTRKVGQARKGRVSTICHETPVA